MNSKVILLLFAFAHTTIASSLILTKYERYFCEGNAEKVQIALDECLSLPIGSEDGSASILFTRSSDVLPVTAGVLYCKFIGSNCTNSVWCENINLPKVCISSYFIKGSLLLGQTYPLAPMVTAWSWDYNAADGTSAFSNATSNDVSYVVLILFASIHFVFMSL